MEVIQKYHLILHLSIYPHLFPHRPASRRGRDLVKEAERGRLEWRFELR